MHNPESVLTNETHKLLWDFEIQTDHQISVKRPDLIIKKKLKESEKKDWCLDLAMELKKLFNTKGMIIPIVIGVLGTLVKGSIQRLGNNRTSGHYTNYSFIEIGQNTENSPGDLKRIAVTQTPVKDHQLTLMRKTLKV